LSRNRFQGKSSVALTILLCFQSLLNFIAIPQLSTMGYPCSKSFYRLMPSFFLVRQCRFPDFCGERRRWSTIHKATLYACPSQ
ncbi:hypothetical protein PSV08DRAFT_265788, partial [Bipolaris maydis]